MRTKQSAAEIEELELAENNRRQTRKSGFSLMSVRDRGWIKLNNGVVLEWPVDRELLDGEVRSFIPKGYFGMVTGDKKIIFDAEEFKKYLRWA